jgi:peroxiredoxin (alkyl hydroperoxide reductase subunit C)
MKLSFTVIFVVLLSATLATSAFGESAVYQGNIYDPGKLKPIDSKLKVKIGDPAPDFTLPAVSGGTISLSQYRGKKKCGAVFCTCGLDAGLLRPMAGI